MTDGGYTLIEAWNLQLQGRVESLDRALHDVGQLFYRSDLSEREKQIRAQAIIKRVAPIVAEEDAPG